MLPSYASRDAFVKIKEEKTKEKKKKKEKKKEKGKNGIKKKITSEDR